MRRLLIIGAGGFGREIFGWTLATRGPNRDWKVGGFLDTDPQALNGFDTPLEVIGDPNTYLPTDQDRFVCAIGAPKPKLQICRDMKRRGARFINLIHPSAIIGPNCQLGHGCVLCPGAILTTGIALGDFVVLNLHASVGHDAKIGAGCTLLNHSDVSGGAVLGEGVLLGSHSVVLPNVRVEDYSVVGAGSVALRKVRDHTTVMGVPATQVYGFKQ